MAAGAGSKAVNIPEKFDPRTATLRDVVQMYVNEARNPTQEGAKTLKLEGWENNFNKPGLKEMLDKPVANLFNGSFDGPENPLAMALNDTAVGSHRDLISAVSVIEDNVKRRHVALKINEEFFTLADSVIKPPRSKKYTSKFGFNVYKVGGLIEALVEHVKQNPADKPVANAIIFGLNSGFRPAAFGGLPVMGFKEAGRPGGPPGIFLPVGFPGVKTDQAINVPLSRRSIAILQDQQEWNQKNLGLGNKASPIFFAKKTAKGELKPIGDSDINRVLMDLVSSFGIKVSVTDIKTPEAAYLTSYDLRRITATAFNALGVDINNAGALQGRPYASNTEQARYIGDAPGVYGDAATRDTNRLSNFYHDQYAKTLPGYNNAENKVLSLNTTYFDSLERKFVNPTTDRPLPVYIQPVEMTPELSGDTVKTTDTAETLDPAKARAAAKKGLGGLDVNKLKLGAGAALDVAGKVGKKVLPVAMLSSAVIASKEAEAQGDSEFIAGMKGVAAGASELLPPGLAFSDREVRKRARDTAPGGSGTGPRTDVAPQTDAMGYIKPEFASYPMEDAPPQNSGESNLQNSKLAEMQVSLQQNEYDGLQFGGTNAR